MKKKFLFVTYIAIVSFLSNCSKPNSQPAPPIIFSIFPKGDTVGGQVTITGSHFSTISSNNIVKFNSIPAPVISASTTQLIVIVPNSVAGSGTVSVSVSGQSTASPTAFRILTPNELFLLGNWVFISSIRSDTLMGGSQSSFQLTNLSPTLNYLTFTDSGLLYSKLQGWGAGLNGSIFADTVNYTVSKNQIFLSFPAGINHYGGNFSNYTAYQDTINIRSLTANSFYFSRNYHFKHIVNLMEIKNSVDSLIK